MVKLYKEQIIFIVVSFIVISLLGFYAINTNTNINAIKTKGKYQKSLDSVNYIANSIISFRNSEYVYTRDIFNFKVEKKKKKVKKIETIKKVVIKRNVKWVDTVVPFKKDRIEMILFMNGKTKMKVDGKVSTFSIGDKVAVGTIVQKQIDVDTGKFTGKTVKKGIYEGKIVHITGRATYILSLGGNAFRLKPSLDPALIKQKHIPSDKKNKVKKSRSRNSSKDRRRERQ